MLYSGEAGQDEQNIDLEITEIIMNIKNNKSGGENRIYDKLIKEGGPELAKWLHKLIMRVWEE